MADNAPKRFDETTTETTSLQKDSNEYVGIAQNSVSKKILTSNLMTKANVGLGNVDNTADADKPVSTAMQSALDDKANSADVYTQTETDNLLADKQDKAITIDEEAMTVEGAIQALSDDKADIAQEDWIEPTLLNGATGSFKYFKDTLGFVHLQGKVTSVSGNIFANLPEGYRIGETSSFACVITSTSYANITVSTSGDVRAFGSNTTDFYVGIITYRAEK